MPFDKRDDRVELEQAVDRRQRATRGSGRIQHDCAGGRRKAMDEKQRVNVNMSGTGAHGADCDRDRTASLAQFLRPMLL